MKKRADLITVNPPSLREMLSRQGIESKSSRARESREGADRAPQFDADVTPSVLPGLEVQFIDPECVELHSAQEE